MPKCMRLTYILYLINMGNNHILSMIKFNGKELQSKSMLMLGDDDIESPYKIVPDIYLYFYNVVSVFVSLS